jgi:hypothetical protein
LNNLIDRFRRCESQGYPYDIKQALAWYDASISGLNSMIVATPRVMAATGDECSVHKREGEKTCYRRERSEWSQ